MTYIKEFNLPDSDTEYDSIVHERKTGFINVYPFNIFSNKELTKIKFNKITIFYGENGSGKSTILNIISEKLNAKKSNNFVKGEYFNKYLRLTSYELSNTPDEIKLISSNDVFDYLNDIKSLNSNIDKNRSRLYEEYMENKYSSIDSIFDYEKLKDQVDSKKKTMCTYTRERLRKNNIQEESNGEAALRYFESEINENSLYILDEPENSLSASSQIKLVKYIEESVRFYNCEFIISTHSPFILSLMDALIYDLDSIPVTTKNWTDLPNVKIYKDFFFENKDKFN